MEVIDAWLLLTRDEQAVISSRLEKKGGDREETHREIFNRIIGAGTDDSRNLNLFFLHWDRRSTEFKHADKRYWTRWGEQRDAGRSHHDPLTATQVREGLRARGIAT